VVCQQAAGGLGDVVEPFPAHAGNYRWTVAGVTGQADTVFMVRAAARLPRRSDGPHLPTRRRHRLRGLRSIRTT